MKPTKTIFFLFICLFSNSIAFSQFQDYVQTNAPAYKTSNSQKNKLNFFIVSKRHKGKLDLASRFNVIRTKLKSLFRKKKFVSIVASNAWQASSKIQYRLKKYNARIGTLWFDSHGMYKKGIPCFLSALMNTVIRH